MNDHAFDPNDPAWPEKLVREIEDDLERSGLIVRCPCYGCGQEVQVSPGLARWATCDACDKFLNLVSWWIDEYADQGEAVQRRVEAGPRKEIVFLKAGELKPGELWRLTLKGRLKLRYFDPSGYTDTRIIYKVQMQLTYL